MPDIQRGGKFRPGWGVALLLIGLGLGWWLGRGGIRHAPPGNAPAPVTGVERPVEIRIDPSNVRLVDTTLELKPMPSSAAPVGAAGERNP